MILFVYTAKKFNFILLLFSSSIAQDLTLGLMWSSEVFMMTLLPGSRVKRELSPVLTIRFTIRKSTTTPSSDVTLEVFAFSRTVLVILSNIDMLSIISLKDRAYGVSSIEVNDQIIAAHFSATPLHYHKIQGITTTQKTKTNNNSLLT